MNILNKKHQRLFSHGNTQTVFPLCLSICFIVCHCLNWILDRYMTHMTCSHYWSLWSYEYWSYLWINRLNLAPAQPGLLRVSLLTLCGRALPLYPPAHSKQHDVTSALWLTAKQQKKEREKTDTGEIFHKSSYRNGMKVRERVLGFIRMCGDGSCRQWHR